MQFPSSSSHTRPVCHIDFSDITECGTSFLISACKGENQDRERNFILKVSDHFRNVFIIITTSCVCLIQKILEIQFFSQFSLALRRSVIRTCMFSLLIVDSVNLNFVFYLFRWKADVETWGYRRLGRDVWRTQRRCLGRRIEQIGNFGGLRSCWLFSKNLGFVITYFLTWFKI